MTTPTLSDDAMLLAAVVAAPDDDAPRLVYADWLDEHGRHEQAEFIRVQIELAGGPNWKDCPDCNGFPKVGPCGLTDYFRDCFSCPSRYKALRERERALLNQHGGDWHGVVPPPDVRLVGEQARDGVATLFFARGFPAHVALPVAALCGPCVTCVACGGDGLSTGPPECRPCRRCKGTGRTGRTGIAAQLARLPLTRVSVTDRNPLRFLGGHWGWTVDDEEQDTSAWLPDQIWKLLEPKGSRRRYPARQAAIDALDAAALLYIRTS